MAAIGKSKIPIYDIEEEEILDDEDYIIPNPQNAIGLAEARIRRGQAILDAKNKGKVTEAPNKYLYQPEEIIDQREWESQQRKPKSTDPDDYKQSKFKSKSPKFFYGGGEEQRNWEAKRKKSKDYADYSKFKPEVEKTFLQKLFDKDVAEDEYISNADKMWSYIQRVGEELTKSTDPGESRSLAQRISSGVGAGQADIDALEEKAYTRAADERAANLEEILGQAEYSKIGSDILLNQAQATKATADAMKSAYSHPTENMSGVSETAYWFAASQLGEAAYGDEGFSNLMNDFIGKEGNAEIIGSLGPKYADVLWDLLAKPESEELLHLKKRYEDMMGFETDLNKMGQIENAPPGAESAVIS